MPGRMSINWLLNEDGDPHSTDNPKLPLPQSQDFQQVRNMPSNQPSPPTNPNSLICRVDQQQQQPPPPANPDMTTPQNRALSESSRATSRSQSAQTRPPRPKYSMEEDHFIWYQRIDLEKDWKEVSQAFNEYFRDRHRDGESGLQCRFYRILDAAGLPNIRSLKNSNDKERIAHFSLVKQTPYRYGWMLPKHIAA